MRNYDDKTEQEIQECFDRVAELKLALKHAYQQIEEHKKETFRYKMLLAGKDEMMNSLGWATSKPEENCNKDNLS